MCGKMEHSFLFDFLFIFLAQLILVTASIRISEKKDVCCAPKFFVKMKIKAFYRSRKTIYHVIKYFFPSADAVGVN